MPDDDLGRTEIGAVLEAGAAWSASPGPCGAVARPRDLRAGLARATARVPGMLKFIIIVAVIAVILFFVVPKLRKR